jgi:hypothetical protein
MMEINNNYEPRIVIKASHMNLKPVKSRVYNVKALSVNAPHVREGYIGL